MTPAGTLDLDRLYDRFAVEVGDVDLREVTATRLYPQIRAAFEEFSLLLFPGQDLLEDLRGAEPGESAERAMLANLSIDG